MHILIQGKCLAVVAEKIPVHGADTLGGASGIIQKESSGACGDMHASVQEQTHSQQVEALGRAEELSHFSTPGHLGYVHKLVVVIPTMCCYLQQLVAVASTMCCYLHHVVVVIHTLSCYVQHIVVVSSNMCGCFHPLALVMSIICCCLQHLVEVNSKMCCCLQNLVVVASATCCHLQHLAAVASILFLWFAAPGGILRNVQICPAYGCNHFHNVLICAAPGWPQFPQCAVVSSI